MSGLSTIQVSIDSLDDFQTSATTPAALTNEVLSSIPLRLRVPNFRLQTTRYKSLFSWQLDKLPLSSGQF
eukprot:8529034-Pyramimonas_sp.AAC.1